jgi:integrase
MANRVNRLTAAFIKKAGPGMYADGGGLWLKIGEGGASWVLRFAVVESAEERRQRKAAGKRQGERQMGLGSLATVDLSTARKLAAEKRLIRASGTDPLAALDAHKDTRRLERAATEAAKQEAGRPKAPIFDHALDDFHIANEGQWRSKLHATEWRDSLVRHVCPALGPKRVDEITILDILAVLKPIWKTRAVTASRIRGRIEKILDRAFVHMHPGDPIAAQKLVSQNPARMNSHLKELLGVQAHTKKKFAALSYRDIGKFMAELRADDSVTSLALQFTILTAARPGMTIAAEWSEVDFAERTWVVPAHKMKVAENDDHVCPLSEQALGILEKMLAVRSGDRIFPVSRTAMWDHARRLRPGITVHGTGRSAFKDWSCDVAEYPDELSELQLAHNVGDATRRSYRRASAVEKRKAMMTAWADFCGAEFSNVVAMPAKVA